MNVLIIEDHPITAMGLKVIIEENFENPKVDIAHNGKEALNFVKNKAYKIILLDITLPNTDTQSLVNKLKRVTENTEILICSNNDPNMYAMNYISMGASGYIHKSSSKQQMVTAINTVLEGQVYVSKEILQNSLNNKGQVIGQQKKLINHLSNRELEVLTHLLNGKRINDIKATMNIHQSTASTLKKRIMEKANVDNLMDLKKKADEGGFG
jgi:DNA-binding NarL/FixJ family response regulator